MSRELSGVIACLQELEIALADLTEKCPEDVRTGLEEVRQAVRFFFKTPSRQQAEKIHSLIRRKTDSAMAPSRRFFREPVTVDGHPTTLEGVAQELAEVLEDLG